MSFLPITFTIPIEPKAQRRVRASSRGKFIKMHKAKEQQHYEQTMEAYMAHLRPFETITCPVMVKIVQYMPIPKSMTKKNVIAAKSGEFPHAKKPDIDNLMKNLFDLMTDNQFWRDDTLVQAVISAKRFDDGKGPRWVVGIFEWKGFQEFCDNGRDK